MHYALSIVIPLIPFFANAAENNATIRSILNQIQTGVLEPLISFLFVLATIIFFWGIIQYVIGGQGGDSKKVDQAKQVMIWGIIGMFIMASAWGIVKVLCVFFGVSCPF